MKAVHYILGFLSAIALLLILIISSFEIAAYSDYAWYEKEYEKYQVLADLEMEMLDVMEVTKEMMSYLRGNREDLIVHTIVDGKKQEFFNDREKAHMVDVRNLFVGGVRLRRGAVAMLILTIGLLLVTKGDWKKVLPRSFLIGTGAILAVTVAFSALISTNFNKYFTLFHELFFDNDLWLLDPSTDLLIRLLPEGFFSDMVTRIGITFSIGMVLLIVGSICMLKIKNIRCAR